MPTVQTALLFAVTFTESITLRPDLSADVREGAEIWIFGSLVTIVTVFCLLCLVQTQEPKTSKAEAPVSDRRTVHSSPTPNRPWLNKITVIIHRCDMER